MWSAPTRERPTLSAIVGASLSRAVDGGGRSDAKRSVVSRRSTTSEAEEFRLRAERVELLLTVL